VLLALDHEHAIGQAFNIGNDCPLTREQFLGAIADEIGASRPRVHIPYRILALDQRLCPYGTRGRCPLRIAFGLRPMMALFLR